MSCININDCEKVVSSTKGRHIRKPKLHTELFICDNDENKEFKHFCLVCDCYLLDFEFAVSTEENVAFSKDKVLSFLSSAIDRDLKNASSQYICRICYSVLNRIDSLEKQVLNLKNNLQLKYDKTLNTHLSVLNLKEDISSHPNVIENGHFPSQSIKLEENIADIALQRTEGFGINDLSYSQVSIRRKDLINTKCLQKNAKFTKKIVNHDKWKTKQRGRKGFYLTRIKMLKKKNSMQMDLLKAENTNTKFCVEVPDAFIEAKVFLCSLCNDKFRKMYDLEIHFRDVHQNCSLMCKFCSRNLKYGIEGYIYHLSIYHSEMLKYDYSNDDSVYCLECSAYFTAAQYLSHMEINHFRVLQEAVHKKQVESKYLEECRELHIEYCPICYTELYGEGVITAHLKENHDADAVDCFYCKVQCTLSEYASHIYSHIRVFCPLCRCSIVMAAFHEHLGEKHNKGNFSCDHCLFTFSEEHILVAHVKFHHDCGLYKCTVCEQTFSSPYHIGVHIRMEHSIVDDLQCLFCSFSFTSQTSLFEHEKQCLPDNKDIHCLICDKSFSLFSSLSIHIKEFHKNTLAAYKEIDKGKETPTNEEFIEEEAYTMNLEELEDRYDVYTEEVSNGPMIPDFLAGKVLENAIIFCCPVCSNRFYGHECFSIHFSQQHSEIKDILCSYCSYMSDDVNILLRHYCIYHPLTMRFKARESDYHYCKECSIFLVVNEFKDHLKNVHKKYMCPYCHLHFTVRNLSYHLSSKHLKKSYTCPECYSVYPYYNLYLHHIRRYHKEYQFICEHCGKKYASRSELKYHIGHKHLKENEFACTFCDRSYVTLSRLKQHLVVHTKEKTNICNICNRTFAWTTSLAKHMKRVHKLHSARKLNSSAPCSSTLDIFNEVQI